MRDELIDAALRRAPEVPVPEGFQARLLARLAGEAPPASYNWTTPAIWFAAAAALAPFATVTLRSGWLDRLETPSVLMTAAVVEAAVSLLWFRRILNRSN
jgi:anti-sigma factor RsiW